MEPNAYTSRELDHYFKDMKDTVLEINVNLKEVRLQTTKTNGRVNKHQWQITAFWWALGVFWSGILLLAPMIIQFIKHEIDISVKESIRKSLSEYNIEVK